MYIVTQVSSHSQKATTTVKFLIGQFPFVLFIDIVMHLVSHCNSNILFQTHSQSLKTATTVKPPTADSPRTRLPLYNGQNVRPRMDFLYIIQDCHLRKATTSEFCTTDSRGRLTGNDATQNYLPEQPNNHAHHKKLKNNY